MDTRTARRVAEKAARTLMNERAALVGELAVVGAERRQLADDVAAAANRGRQLVTDAEAQAARLVTAAQDLATDGEQRYADVYSAATAGGWTAGDLTSLGFAPSSSNPQRRRRASAGPPAPAVQLPEVTVPEQHDAPEATPLPLPTP